MGLSAVSAQQVATDWSNAATWEFSEDVEKLDIYVMAVGVQMQVLEGNDRAYPADVKQYVLLRVGFHSIPFATPIRRFRLRQWPEDPNYGKEVEKKPCEVDWRAYA